MTKYLVSDGNYNRLKVLANENFYRWIQPTLKSWHFFVFSVSTHARYENVLVALITPKNFDLGLSKVKFPDYDQKAKKLIFSYIFQLSMKIFVC